MKQFSYKLRLWVSLFLLLMVSASYAEDEKMDRKLARPFSAELVEYNRHNQKLQKKSRVQIGKDGLRMTKLAPGSDKPVFTYIQNFQTQQEWMVSPGKLYYAELPAADDLQAARSGEEAEDAVDIPMGVMGSEPCQGMEKQKRGERGLKGTQLSVWECKPENGAETYLQHYSTLLGVVIRQESSKGHTFELRDIKLDPPDAEEFKPSRLWREVTLEEFFTGAPTLPDYIESDLR